MTIQPYNPPLPAHLNGHVAQDTLTQDEYERFKAVLPSWRDRLITMLLRNTGLPINQLLEHLAPTVPVRPLRLPDIIRILGAS